MARLLKHEKKNPFTTNKFASPFLSLHHEVDKAMSELTDWFGESKSLFKEFDNCKINPAIDFVEDSKCLKIEAEMPGMDEKDITLSIDNHMLTLTGDKTTSKKDKGKNYSMREINYGHYERSINLPENLDLNKAKATFKKGMLWIEIPKKLVAGSRRKTLKIEKAPE